MVGVQKQFNPASVNVLLGYCLTRFDEAMGRGDLEAGANELRSIRRHVGTFMTIPEKTGYAELPGYATGDGRLARQVGDDMQEQAEYLQRIAVRHNIYARGQHDVGSADDEEAA